MSIVTTMGEENGSQKAQVAAVIVGIILLVAIFVYLNYYYEDDDGTNGTGGGGSGSDDDCPNWTIHELDMLEWDGYVSDQTDEEETFDIEARRPVELRVNLTWEDEEPSGPLWTNEPDTFNMSVYGPTGRNETVSGDSGFLEMVIPLNATGDVPADWNGEWEVVLSMDAGDEHSGEGLFRTREDAGNTFVLNATFAYHQCVAEL